ncbi:hypothetical protein GCM10009555_082380 [Acrocarpospora macrocephala]|uniref:Uncharacterized protein n=1 Tax=Acrocarpospora macrocephala TaxID=150177 RepID=A0A5M3WWC4_9ACTN|nr:hypothetical protein [Acrocarpospora macrocephala]GES10873.1 hypothetical protein Amac_044700 [Acrocarpospora macrocephala]
MAEKPSVPPGTGPLAPEFSGIDPALMNSFITELERAGQVIAEQAENIRRELAAVDLPAAGLAPIREIGGWAEQQLPRLRQRVAAITAPVPGLLGIMSSPGLRPYREASLLTPAEAQRLGTDLGRRFEAINPDEFSLVGPYASDRIAAVLDELEAHQHDAVFTAAFFAALGPAGTRKVLPALWRLPEEDRPEARRALGTAFATAVSGGAKVPGFAAVIKAVEDIKAEDAEGMEALATLLSHGNYPDVWLAELVTPALRPDSRISGPTLAGLFNALGNNPAAARLAIGRAARLSPLPSPPALPLPSLGPLPPSPEAWDKRPELAAFLKGLNERANKFPEESDAFGRLLAAASGAYDEQDGKHSKEAAFFAYTVMTTADEWKLNDATRIHMAEIAGSYATEITLGANLNDADVAKDSALQVAPGLFEWTSIPGLRGTFRLSPEDTFRFMTTFAGNDDARLRFDESMGEFVQRVLPTVSNSVKSSGNTDSIDNLFKALGSVRGAELAAAVRVLKPKDERAESVADAESTVIGGAMAALGLTYPLTAIPIAWTVLSTGVSTYYTYGRNPEEKVDELLESDEAETLGRRHVMAELLMKQGFAPQTLPAGIIADSNGHLRPFEDILRQRAAGVRAFDQWMVDNGMGKGNPLSLGELISQQANNFVGNKEEAYDRRVNYANTELTTD